MCGPSLRAESSLIDIVQTALLVALSAILLTLVVPAVIAFRGGVYYHGSLVQKLPNDAQVKLARHTQEKTQLETQLVLIDRRRVDSAHGLGLSSASAAGAENKQRHGGRTNGA